MGICLPLPATCPAASSLEIGPNLRLICLAQLRPRCGAGARSRASPVTPAHRPAGACPPAQGRCQPLPPARARRLLLQPPLPSLPTRSPPSRRPPPHQLQHRPRLQCLLPATAARAWTPPLRRQVGLGRPQLGLLQKQGCCSHLRALGVFWTGLPAQRARSVAAGVPAPLPAGALCWLGLGWQIDGSWPQWSPYSLLINLTSSDCDCYRACRADPQCEGRRFCPGGCCRRSTSGTVRAAGLQALACSVLLQRSVSEPCCIASAPRSCSIFASLLQLT